VITWPLLAGLCSKEQIRWIAGKCNLYRDDHRNQTIQERLASLWGAGVQPVFLSREQLLPRVLSLRRDRILKSNGAVRLSLLFDEADRKRERYRRFSHDFHFDS
jgi:hypothetical protein